jgi:hypothetical protein
VSNWPIRSINFVYCQARCQELLTGHKKGARQPALTLRPDFMPFRVQDHPVIASCALAFVGSFLGLRPIPSSIPLIALLVVLRISTIYIISGYRALLHLCFVWLALTIGCIISFSSAGSTAISSSIPTIAYSMVFTLLGLIPLSVAAKFRITGFLFPAVWSTWWDFITTESPIGRLGVWAPLSGDSAYSWTRPFVGESGIDWAVGGWTEVLMYFVTWHLMGRPDPNENGEVSHEGQLIPTEEENGLPPAGPTTETKAPTIWAKYQISILAVTLIALSLPSNFINTLPAPLHGDDLRQIGVACVLPEPTNDISPLELFIRETLTVTNRAHVVLWPEGAVYFDSEADRQEKLEWVRGNATHNGATIGVSFTEPAPSEGDKQFSGKKRNGIALVNRDGVLLEYYKRHLVPRMFSFSSEISHFLMLFLVVESFPQVAGKVPSPVVNITEGAKRKPSHQWNFTLSANICLDFAHPSHDLDVKPTLILGPARTWHTNVGQVMMEMARHRAEELGTRVLWCDGGEGGLSGVVGQGESGIQVGYGSWIKDISVELPLDGKRTPFAREAGQVLAIGAAWAFFFITFLPERKKERQNDHISLLKAARQKISQIFRPEPEQPLIEV